MNHQEDVKKAFAKFVTELESMGYTVNHFGYSIDPTSKAEHEGNLNVHITKPRKIEVFPFARNYGLFRTDPEKDELFKSLWEWFRTRHADLKIQSPTFSIDGEPPVYETVYLKDLPFADETGDEIEIHGEKVTHAWHITIVSATTAVVSITQHCRSKNWNQELYKVEYEGAQLILDKLVDIRVLEIATNLAREEYDRQQKIKLIETRDRIFESIKARL